MRKMNGVHSIKVTCTRPYHRCDVFRCAATKVSLYAYNRTNWLDCFVLLFNYVIKECCSESNEIIKKKKNSGSKQFHTDRHCMTMPIIGDTFRWLSIHAIQIEFIMPSFHSCSTGQFIFHLLHFWPAPFKRKYSIFMRNWNNDKWVFVRLINIQHAMYLWIAID